MNVGDMFRPSCSLCRRTLATCIYPTERKLGQRRRRHITDRSGDSCDKQAGPSAAGDDAPTSDWDVFFNLEYVPSVLVPDHTIHHPQPLPSQPQQQELQGEEPPSTGVDASMHATGPMNLQQFWGSSERTITNIGNILPSPSGCGNDIDSDFSLSAINQARDFSIADVIPAQTRAVTNASIHPESIFYDPSCGMMPQDAISQPLKMPFNEPLNDNHTNINLSMTSTDDATLFEELEDRRPLSSLSISKDLAYDL